MQQQQRINLKRELSKRFKKETMGNNPFTKCDLPHLRAIGPNKLKSELNSSY